MRRMLILSCFVGALAQAATAQMQTMPPSETVGLITEAVARQRLVEHGYNLQSLYLQDSQYRATAVKDGKTINVWMDAKTGRIEEKNAP
jgi:Peptidase propeptide and YPEB domain